MKHSFVDISIKKIVIYTVGVHAVFTLFCSDISNAMSFCGEFSKNSWREDGVLDQS
jgi:hypothetical protein